MRNMPVDARPVRPSGAPEGPQIKRAAAISVAPLTPSELETLKTSCQEIRQFDDGDELLVSPNAYEHDLFVIGSGVPMRESIGLVTLLNRRSKAPILAWKARAPCASWLDAGADMWLPLSATVDDLVAAIRALGRRISLQGGASPVVDRTWRLHVGARQLLTPAGQQIPLTDTDSLVLQCFVGTEGAVVSHSELGVQLGHPLPEADNWLRATMYRLRRRIEQATGEAAPIDAQARQGYLFRGRLQLDV